MLYFELGLKALRRTGQLSRSPTLEQGLTATGLQIVYADRPVAAFQRGTDVLQRQWQPGVAQFTPGHVQAGMVIQRVFLLKPPRQARFDVNPGFGGQVGQIRARRRYIVHENWTEHGAVGFNFQADFFNIPTDQALELYGTKLWGLGRSRHRDDVERIIDEAQA